MEARVVGILIVVSLVLSATALGVATVGVVLVPPPQGLTGPQGEQGLPGIQGPQGEQGTQGPAAPVQGSFVVGRARITGCGVNIAYVEMVLWNIGDEEATEVVWVATIIGQRPQGDIVAEQSPGFYLPSLGSMSSHSRFWESDFPCHEVEWVIVDVTFEWS